MPTLSAMSNLAITPWQMPEHQEVLQLMQAAAESLERTLGPDHPNTQNSVKAMQQMLAALQQGTRG
ncbi:MAG: hypothetical protein C3F18_12255 [Nitrosomonadales bacterium]|nr:MAG: hypothetical protein C3F18_12255 [Nitrosomonadales bacterium]